MERVTAEATTFGVFGSHFFIYISLLPLLSLACSFSIMEDYNLQPRPQPWEPLALFSLNISLLPLLSLACSFSIMERVTAEATALGTVGSVDGGRVSFT